MVQLKLCRRLSFTVVISIREKKKNCLRRSVITCDTALRWMAPGATDYTWENSAGLRSCKIWESLTSCVLYIFLSADAKSTLVKSKEERGWLAKVRTPTDLAVPLPASLTVLLEPFEPFCFPLAAAAVQPWGRDLASWAGTQSYCNAADSASLQGSALNPTYLLIFPSMSGESEHGDRPSVTPESEDIL